MPFKLVITTTRNPPKRTSSFVTDLVRSIPDTTKLMRGGKSIEDLFYETQRREASKLLIVYSFNGNPSRLDYYDFSLLKNEPVSIILMRGVSLSREIGMRERPVFSKLYHLPIPKWAVKGFKNDISLLLDVFGSEPLESAEQLNELRKTARREHALVTFRKSNTAYAFNVSFQKLTDKKEVGPRIRIREIRFNTKLSLHKPSTTFSSPMQDPTVNSSSTHSPNKTSKSEAM